MNEQADKAKYPGVTISAVITAPARALFDIVADVSRHPELAGSQEVQSAEWITPMPARAGSRFQSRQRIGLLRYPSRSCVQVCQPPHQFTWLSGFGFERPPLGQLWGFEFQPLGDGSSTLVMHSMMVPVPFLPVPPFTWLADAGARHEADNMRPTLSNLARMAGARVIGDTRVVLEPCPSHRALVARR
jgi:hypothetical protein